MLRFYLLQQDIIHIQSEEFLSAFLIKLPRCLSKENKTNIKLGRKMVLLSEHEVPEVFLK